jgi:choline dehydrogenase-like flavoprotein
VLLDARGVADGATLDADVCIVGAGAAGITIARELAGGRLDVLLLESGGLEHDPRTQELARGEVSAHSYPPLESARLRMFGGSTNHWNGWCRPLDPVDLERRPAVPHSGWPIEFDELDPYYEGAQSICELGPYEYDGRHWASSSGGSVLRLGGEAFETSIFQFSPPTNFGRVYREPLARARNVRVLLHANATRIVTSDNGARAEQVRVATLSGRRFAVRARRVVVACGGIDNARLLLASGVGEPHGPVGRFFAEHPHAPVALAVLPATTAPLYAGIDAGETRVRAAIASTASLAREEGLLRTSVTLDPFETDPYVDRQSEREAAAAAFGRDVASVAGGLEASAFRVFALYLRAEQAPNPSSRVTLAAETDPLGVPRARLEWRLGELDRRSVERTVALLGEALGSAGSGRVFSRPSSDLRFVDGVGGGYHHMGTTRMGADPRTSVVDRNCRAHAVDNLYVAGSSVFPTSGYANPTLTIVALALRLADHLTEGSSR